MGLNAAVEREGFGLWDRETLGLGEAGIKEFERNFKFSILNFELWNSSNHARCGRS